MGLLYKSEKRAIFKGAIFVVLALALLGASIRFWYVSVPVLLLLVLLVVALRNRNQRAIARARESVVLSSPVEMGAPSSPPASDDVPPPDVHRSTVADLSALAEMRSRGLLSEAEFDAAKHRILAE